MISWILSSVSHSVVSDSLQTRGLWPTRLLCPWGFSRQEHWSGFATSFSKGSSRPKDRTPIFCTAGRFLTVWATKGKAITTKKKAKQKNPKMTLYRSFPFLRKVILIMFLCHVTYCYMNGKLKYKTIIVTIQSQSTIENNRKDFPVIQWLRLHTPNAGGLGSIPSQGTRFHMPHPRISVIK